MKKRISAVERRRIIIQYLRGRDDSSGLTVKEITDRLNNDDDIIIDSRNVRRDLVKLSNDHGVTSDGETPERFFIMDDFGTRHKLELSYPTLQALIIALNNLKVTSHNYFTDVTTAAETAILECLDEDLASKLRESKSHYYFDFSISGRPSSGEVKEFEKIMYAVRERLLFTCQNIAPSKPDEYNSRERTFAPYFFVLSTGMPYLICQDMEDLTFKNLLVTRIRNVSVSKERFSPANFEDENFLLNMVDGYGGLDKAPTKISIVGDKTMALHFQERQIHNSQEITDLGDDNFRITLTCALSSAIPRMLSGFGGHIHSIEPKELEEQVKAIWRNGLKSVA